ncbi:TlpA disulfide reductase family protein [Soonwooa sp.]|uniref:TlpA family protein disulfide reductase n=1 Tax=Soonwooa sp. TaxID=1938592 RepID=UPI00262B6471|nr:TlpA disulfide reductase family protein [Soonwooa sp.]
MRKSLNIMLIGLAMSVIFVPEAKAYVQQGLMKLGFFQPKLELPKEITGNTEEPKLVKESNFQMSFVDSKGKTLSLAELEGKVVFMNIWATWCGPCIAEMPSIQKLYDKFKDKKDVAFVILEAESNKDKAVKFMANKNLDLPVYFPNGAIPTDFFRGSLPTTVIFDKNGNVAHITEGMADYSGDDIVDFLNEVRAMK